MAAAAILKIRKIAISPQRNDRIWRNLVQWCAWDLQIPTANKKSLFQKSNMATSAFLKNRKIVISLQPIDRFWRNLVQWCIWALQTPTVNKILWIRQSKMAALEKSKTHNMFATDWPILTKFGMLMRLDPLRPNNQHFSISKNPRWWQRPFWNLEIFEIGGQLPSGKYKKTWYL